MKFVIRGGKRLSGTVKVAGAKNACLPIIASSLLTEEPCTIRNVPRISDVDAILQILRSLGCRALWTGPNQLAIDTKGARARSLDRVLVKRFRASVVLCGPMLTRFATVTIPEPGGCILGNRPMDTHVRALESLGVQVRRGQTRYEQYRLSRKNLIGTTVILKEASVTATENLLMAASRARGTTIIKNAACEPHVQDLAVCLKKMGVRIDGIGGTTLRIEGVSRVRGFSHRVIPDPIEAGTFIILSLATRSSLTVTGVRPDHLDVVLETLRESGARFDIGSDFITILPMRTRLAPFDVRTRVYPGIPTDLQALFGVLATQASGTSSIHETLFDGRLNYLSDLARMGARVRVRDLHRARITGPSRLKGKEIRSLDIRAGIALVIAALAARGVTTIHRVELIDRGYEHIEERLKSVGADITRIT